MMIRKPQLKITALLYVNPDVVEENSADSEFPEVAFVLPELDADLTKHQHIPAVGQQICIEPYTFFVSADSNEKRNVCVPGIAFVIRQDYSPWSGHVQLDLVTIADYDDWHRGNFVTPGPNHPLDPTNEHGSSQQSPAGDRLKAPPEE
jgi:hypothetical protein